MAIGNAVRELSKYKPVDLSAYKAVFVKSVRFINVELKDMGKTCVHASDVLNCVSVGIGTAINDHIPYKNTPVLIKTAGRLPAIPYAGIAMAGITWGMSGSLAKARALEEAVAIGIETERMARVLSGLKAVENRVAEGGDLVRVLSGKIKKSLGRLQSLAAETEGNVSEAVAKEIDASIRLVKSLKQVIETDICNADGLLTKKSGVVFRKIEREVRNAR